MFPRFIEGRVCVCALHSPSCFCMVSQGLRGEERSLRLCLKSELQTGLGEASGAGGGRAQERRGLRSPEIHSRAEVTWSSRLSRFISR